MERNPIKTYVWCDNGEMPLIDTIEHEGGLWLVPKWLETPYPNMHRPARIIRMDALVLHRHGDIYNNGVEIRKLDGPVPRAVLDGDFSLLSAPLLDAVEAPDIMFRR